MPSFIHNSLKDPKFEIEVTHLSETRKEKGTISRLMKSGIEIKNWFSSNFFSPVNYIFSLSIIYDGELYSMETVIFQLRKCASLLETVLNV